MAASKNKIYDQRRYNPQTIEAAYLELASAILQAAIEDVRHNKNHEKRAWAKEFLLSKAASFMFDMVLTNQENINLREWVEMDCPELKKHER